MWWAKIRPPRRDWELPHAAEIAAIQSQIDDDVETYLYLTDYRLLYVGQLGEVTADAVLEDEGEAEHAPSYSLYESGTCVAWWPMNARHARGPRSPA